MAKRILIVEDDNISFMVGSTYFIQEGYVTERAISGEDAVTMFMKSVNDNNPYDCIYMDLGLPKISGIETCKLIRKYEAENSLSLIPIIAVTANDNKNIIIECVEAGMMDALFKPLTKEKIAIFSSYCDQKNNISLNP